MKQTILLIIFCIVSGVTYAQVQTGSTLIGGTLGGNISRPNAPATNVSSFTLKPAAGKFINEKWLLGMNGEYRLQKVENSQYVTHNSGNNETQHIRISNPKNQNLAIGPMARYYQEVMPKLYVFGEGSIGYSYLKNHFTYSSYATDQYGQQLYHSESNGSVKTQYLYGSISPGIVLFPATKIGIELKTNVVSYSHGIGNGPNQDPYTFANTANMERNLTVSLTLASTSIGIGYYF